MLAIYVASIAALFGVSAAFHRIKWSPRARRLMRRADHATIFVGIAGTYTAVAGICLSGWTRVLVLALVWAGAVVGIVLRQVWLDAPKWAVALPYVVVGWSALGGRAPARAHHGRRGIRAPARRRRRLHGRRHRLRETQARPVPDGVRVPRDLPRLHRGRCDPCTSWPIAAFALAAAHDTARPASDPGLMSLNGGR